MNEVKKCNGVSSGVAHFIMWTLPIITCIPYLTLFPVIQLISCTLVIPISM